MTSLDKYKPGQIITQMTKRVFVELWDEMQSGKALEGWPTRKLNAWGNHDN